MMKKRLRKYIDSVRPHFAEGGRLHALRSVFDGFETFLFVPRDTASSGTHIHSGVDSKRIMSYVVLTLMPALLFGMYNVGWQNYAAAGTLATASPIAIFLYGFLAVLPKIVVSYVVGLGIEFIVAQWKGEEIQEGFLVSGILIPMIVPVTCPLWMLALAVAFAVIFAKEIFGGTGMNILNVALVARAFLFFSYPSSMAGDCSLWIADGTLLGLGNELPDVLSQATPLGEVAAGATQMSYSLVDCITGFIPGSIGETSVIAIALGALFLLVTKVANWRTMCSVFLGGILTAMLFGALGMTPLAWYEHLVIGGFCFGAVFMATDPVTGARTHTGQYIYGFLIGVVAVMVRVMNPGYPEGMMLAILLMNVFAPLIDHCVVSRNISKRMKRL